MQFYDSSNFYLHKKFTDHETNKYHNHILGISLVICLTLSIYYGVAYTNIIQKDDQKPEPDPQPQQKCHLQACHKIDPTKFSVHIVPHTHDDTGWKRTVDVLYYNRVQQILNGVVSELPNNPDRRFIYVEMAFFSRWWENQNEEIKNKTRNLVNSGQLSFNLGHWSAPDEATTTYNDLISNLEAGLWFLKSEFGECGQPINGWLVDSFGHSIGVKKLWKYLGFESLFFGRVDYEEYYGNRSKNNSLELLWGETHENNPDLENDQMFTYFLNRNSSESGYGSPKGFDWDSHYNWKREINLGDPYIQDDPKLENFNVDQIVDHFYAYIMEESQGKYISNNFLIPFGGDFWWRNPNQVFTQLDKLIQYTNEKYGDQVNVFYSTPACYYQAWKGSEKMAPIDTKSSSADFYPYCLRKSLANQSDT